MPKFETSSSITAGLQCPTLYKYKYVDLYRTLPTVAMFTGLTIHKGLEGFFSFMSLKESIDKMEKYMDEELPGWTDDQAIAWEKMKVYLECYFLKWSPDDLEGMDIYIEQEFRFKSDLGLEFGGKWDVLIYDPKTMTALIYEHKTTSSKLESEADSYFAKLPLDVQCTIYREAAYQFLTTKECKLVEMPRLMYDVIKTTKSKPKTKKRIVKRKNETDAELLQRKEDAMETVREFGERIRDEYFPKDGESKKYFRHEVPYVASNHKRRLIELTEYAKLLSSKGFQEIRNSTSCGNYGGCAFMDVCLGRERLDDSLKFVKTEEKHPELDGKGNTKIQN